ncbi:MAG: ATP phosphoribosyltransferase regulatory subunit [Clostridia bacterium]|nr:ATP phosphoribosyltransferase regulatory subunit [Clostridia bacterium]
MISTDRKEQLKSSLCSLYEQYGYRRFRMRSFETYDFYAQHREFLADQNLITFQNLDGTLLALKPDITLSIVKNWNTQTDGNEKWYYSENVYRPSRQMHEYREISQIGLEYLGKVGSYTQLEILSLALKSLSLIEMDFSLDLSHIGFISPLLDRCGFDEENRSAALALLSQKNEHELRVLCEKCSVPSGSADDLLRLLSLSGPVPEILLQARSLCRNAQMENALEEISLLYRALASDPLSRALRLDFSLVNNMRYYNALVFAGYLPSLPRVVLSGGRYDLLPQSMGKKDEQAIGFAIALDEVERMLIKPQSARTDVLLLTGGKADLNILQEKVQELVSRGLSVRVEETPSDHYLYSSCYRWEDGSWKEV